MHSLTTLCYIEKENQYLMLHRISKKNDVNKDKWIGVGGHFEQDESPEECLLREVKEETGTISPTRANPIEATAAVSSLIIHLCGEAKARRVRDEYKSYEAIAALMTSLNKG